MVSYHHEVASIPLGEASRKGFWVSASGEGHWQAGQRYERTISEYLVPFSLHSLVWFIKWLLHSLIWFIKRYTMWIEQQATLTRIDEGVSSTSVSCQKNNFCWPVHSFLDCENSVQTPRRRTPRWSFAIRLFSVISKTLIGGGTTPLQRCSQCILQPQPTGQVKFCLNLAATIFFWKAVRIIHKNFKFRDAYYTRSRVICECESFR